MKKGDKKKQQKAFKRRVERKQQHVQEAQSPLRYIRQAHRSIRVSKIA